MIVVACNQWPIKGHDKRGFPRRVFHGLHLIGGESMLRMLRSGILPLALLVQVGLFAQTTTLEDIFAEPVIENLLVSPDGKHLVGVGPYGFQFMDADTLQMTSKRISVDLRARESMRDLFWVNDERVVYTVEMIVGPSPFPWWPNNYYSVNANGNRHSNPFNRGSDAPDIHLRIRDINESNPRTVLMQEKEFRNWQEVGDSTPAIVELDIYSKKKGKRTNRQKGPVSYGDLFVDREGIARVAIGYPSGTPTMHFRTDAESEWKNISESAGIEQFGSAITFLGFAPDNKSFYVLGNHVNGLTNLYLFAPDESSYDVLYGNDEFDIDASGVRWTADRGEILGVTIKDPFSSFVPLASEDLSARYWLTLAQNDAFAGHRLGIVGLSQDGNVMLLVAESMTNPGMYYRFNAKKRQLDPVTTRMPSIVPSEMSNTAVHRVKTKDGLNLYVNITVPQNSEGPVPLIVLPHAGPHEVYDEFGFNPVVQAYALHGYAVVQVNYRGSAGRGVDFATAGFGEWGGAIIDDVLAATRYAASQDSIDGERICIAGSHYGAFVALSAAIREPDMFKCAVGNQGLYDLSLMWNGQIPAWPIAPWLLSAAIGNDMEALAEMSPTTNADKLKVPVFLSHGGKDGFAPTRHHQSMVSALRRQQVEFENVDEISRQHGFRDPENRVKLYTQILEFVEKHI